MKSLRNKADVAQRQRMAQRQLSTDFLNHALEWRRIFAEAWGTFLLVVDAGGCARAYGNVGHLFHGHSERSPLKPGGYLSLRGSAELPVEPSAGLRLSTSRRWCLGGAFPPGPVRYYRRAWGDGARQRHRQRKSVGDGSAANSGVGEHDPGYGLRSTQHRHQRRNRSGRIYCFGGTLRRADHRRLDEPGEIVWAGFSARQLQHDVDLRSRAGHRRAHWGHFRMDSQG